MDGPLPLLRDADAVAARPHLHDHPPALGDRTRERSQARRAGPAIASTICTEAGEAAGTSTRPGIGGPTPSSRRPRSCRSPSASCRTASPDGLGLATLHARYDQRWQTFVNLAEHEIVARLHRALPEDVSYTPDLWTTPYYGTLWGDCGYGWGTMYISGSAREDLVLGVETLVFKVPEDKLVWAGVSEKTNPKGAQQVVKDLVKESIQEMSKVGLVPKGAK